MSPLTRVGVLVVALVVTGCGSVGSLATAQPTWTASDATACGALSGALSESIAVGDGFHDSPTTVLGDAIYKYGSDISHRQDYLSPVDETVSRLKTASETTAGSFLQPQLGKIIGRLDTVRGQLPSPMTQHDFDAVSTEIMNIDYAIESLAAADTNLSANCSVITDWVNAHAKQ
jgi:hypothetical protein